MDQNFSLETFHQAKVALRQWLPEAIQAKALKHQLLDFLDIMDTEQERLRERCRAGNVEQQQMEMALCHTNDAIVITSANGIIRLINPAFEKLTGFGGSELIGENHNNYWSDSCLGKVGEMMSMIRSGSDWQGDLMITSRFGETFDVQTSVVPIIRPTGEITHFVYTLHNVSQRLKLEKRLNRQAEFLEKVINLNPSVIIILDENGEWMLDNLAAKTLISDLGTNARQKLSSEILILIRNPQQTEIKKLKLRMPDRSSVSLMMLSEEIPAKYLLPDGDGRVVYLITLSDITQNEQHNREILIRQKALLASRIEKNMIQGEFVKGFAYGLQKPLNISKAILSRVRQAVEHNRIDQVDQSVQLLHHQVESLETEIAKFSSLPQQMPDKTETTDAAELSDAIKILYRDQFETGLIELIREKDISVTYPLPYEMMQLMIKILTDNALDAIDDVSAGINVRISFRGGRQCSLIIVEDSGPGISKADRYKIFEPFYTTKPKQTGLSLTILHQLLNSAKGSIELDRSDLGGAKLTLFFPTEF